MGFWPIQNKVVIRFVMAEKTEVDICFVYLEELKQDKALTFLSCGHDCILIIIIITVYL